MIGRSINRLIPTFKSLPPSESGVDTTAEPESMTFSARIVIVIALSLAVTTLASNGGRIGKRPILSANEKRDGQSASLTDIPQYVLDYAPLVHLFSEERYWPSDVGEHLLHTTPYLNYTPVSEEEQHPTLDNLALLNKYGAGRFVYLQSNDDVEDDPEWMKSDYGIPGKRDPAQKNNEKGRHNDQNGNGDPVSDVSGTNRRSAAPAVLVVVEKEDGIVDAFWFFFYSFNLGNTFFGIRFGNHVGDWEHFCLRFQNGVPKETFFSEHAWGSAFTYDALEKIEERPVIYSSSGTHAMYSTPGVQSYILPFSILHDTTDRGPIWDPVQNLYAYNYKSLSSVPNESIWSTPNGQVFASSLTPHAPMSYLIFAGAWGDKEYPMSDKRQYGAPFVSDKHYTSGPRGPLSKHLDRRNVCPYEKCIVKDSTKPRSLILKLLINWAAACLVFWVLVGIGFTAFVGWRQTWTFFKLMMEPIDKEEALDVDDERRPLLANRRNSGSPNVTPRTPLLGNGAAN